jgi:replicative DNA helicase
MTREETALSSLAQLGGIDPAKASALLDELGMRAEDFGPLQRIAAAVEFFLREGRAPEVFGVSERSKASREQVVKLLVSNSPGNWLPLRQQLEGVREDSRRRQLLSALDLVRKSLATGELNAAASEGIKLLEAAQSHHAHVRPVSEHLLKLVNHVEEVAAGRQPPVLETGFKDLDEAIGGLQPTLTVIGSLPGKGKSALLAGIVLNLAMRGVKSGIVSLEDEGQWLARRLTALKSQLPVFVLANRPLGSHQLERFGEAVEQLYTPMESALIDDRSRLTTREVVTSCRNMLSRGARALFVDHLGEIRIERSDRHDLDISEALSELRAMAKSYRVPVVVLCHLKRSSEETPVLTDFAFSAGVERMARVALALTRDNDGPLRVHVLKQTQGPSDVAVELDFDKSSGVVCNG